MAENILDSYLVKVSAFPDAASFTELGSVLKTVDVSSSRLVSNITGAMTRFEIVSLSAFSAVGAGLIGLADKTAMTDQSYRLMGMRMLMTKDSARAMQLSLSELGSTLDEVAYDPELNERFQRLYEMNIKMGKQMGSSFDQNMMSIRDLRTEYKMLGTEIGFLASSVISDLFDKLGFSSGDLLNKMEEFNKWFIDNLPGMSDAVSSYLIPVWKDAKLVISSVGSTIKTVVGEFTYLTGVLFNDKSIQNTTFNLQNTAKAFVDWMDHIAEAVLTIDVYAKMVAHTIGGIGASISSYGAAMRGDWKRYQEQGDLSAKEFSIAGKDLNDLNDAMASHNGNTHGITGKTEWKTNSDLSGLLHLYSNMDHSASLPATQDSNGDPISTGESTGNSVTDRFMTSIRGEEKASPTSEKNLSKLLDTYGKKYNVNPELLAAIMWRESRNNPGLTSPKGAEGLMQIMPKTAEQYGVKNPYNPEENIEGGAHFISDLLKKYNGDTSLALAAYNAGPKAVDGHKGIPPFKETQDYVKDVIRQFQVLSQISQGAGGQVIIENMTITVPKALPDDKWAQFVHDSVAHVISKNTRTTTAQTAGGAFF